jgi:hypothetical protein
MESGRRNPLVADTKTEGLLAPLAILMDRTITHPQALTDA